MEWIFFCSILKNNSQIAMGKSFLNNLKNKTISNEAVPEYILASLLVCVIFDVVLILKNGILCYKILNQRSNLFQRYAMGGFFSFFFCFFVFLFFEIGSCYVPQADLNLGSFQLLVLQIYIMILGMKDFS